MHPQKFEFVPIRAFPAGARAIRESRGSIQVGSLGSGVTWQSAWALEDDDDSEDITMLWEIVDDMTMKFEELKLSWDDIEMADMETDDMEVDS